MLILILILVIVAYWGASDGRDGEPVTPPVANPARAESLAGRYEPNLMIERHDGFWPVAVRTVDFLRSGGTSTCLAADADAQCKPAHIRDLPWASGSELSYLNFPANSRYPDRERDSVVEALGSNAPGTAARMYYYVTGRDPDRPVTLQYWFYYPFNYLEARLPLGVPPLNTDLHEGDVEGLSILLSARQKQPVYVWMPRHRDEGERFTWNQGALQLQGSHPIGFVAKGSHATYESCGHKYRSARVAGLPFRGLPDDSFSCAEGAGYPLSSEIPALNLARTWWACWPGHLGYAPHNPSPLSEIYADGPASPLYQQKFGLRKPQPCAGIDAPAPPEPGRELLADPETAVALSKAGGRLNELFLRCENWWQRPPEGSYMVACDQSTLDAFFESGLEDPGDQNLRIDGEPEPRGPMVPAVFAAPKPQDHASQGVDLATIRSDRSTEPVVYVAVRDKAVLRVAHFPKITLRPDQRLQLRRDSNSLWRLVDVAAKGETVAEASVLETETPTRPQAPNTVVAIRRGDVIELRFSVDDSEDASFSAYAGATRDELLEGGRPVGAVAGQPSGKYELTVADPGREIRFLRIVAFAEGTPAASPLVAVSAGP